MINPIIGTRLTKLSVMSTSAMTGRHDNVPTSIDQTQAAYSLIENSTLCKNHRIYAWIPAMTPRLQLDFHTYQQLFDRVVGGLPNKDYSASYRWLQIVADHGGDVRFGGLSPPYVIIEFDSPQELDIFVLKYM